MLNLDGLKRDLEFLCKHRKSQDLAEELLEAKVKQPSGVINVKGTVGYVADKGTTGVLEEKGKIITRGIPNIQAVPTTTAIDFSRPSPKDPILRDSESYLKPRDPIEDVWREFRPKDPVDTIWGDKPKDPVGDIRRIYGHNNSVYLKPTKGSY